MTAFLYLWEILVNIIETTLIYYLLVHYLAYKKNKKWMFPIAFIIRIVIESSVNFCKIDFPFSSILIFLFDCLFIFSCFEGTKMKKLLLGFSYVVIAAFSEIIPFLIASAFTSYSFIILDRTGRVVRGLMYLFVFFISVILLTYRRSNKKWKLPTHYKVILFIVLALGNVISYVVVGRMNNAVNNKDLSSLTDCLILCNFFLIVLISILAYKRNLEIIQNREWEKLEQQQYLMIKEQIQTLRIWKHDFQSHLGIIQELAKSEDKENLSQYISQYSKEFSETMNFASTGNSILDAIISSKLCTAQKNKIKFNYKIYLPDNEIPIDNIKFVSLLSNLLDNAFEACMNLNNAESPFVFLSIKPHRDMLYIEVRNSSSGIYRYDKKGNLLTLKSEPFHGMGMKHVKHLVKQAKGLIDIIPEETAFTVKILITSKTLSHFRKDI